MWYTYIILCSDNSYYTGITTNLTKREDSHNKGVASKYTRGRLPVRLIWFEEAENRSKASKMEYKIKQLSKDKKLIMMYDRGHVSVGNDRFYNMPACRKEWNNLKNTR